MQKRIWVMTKLEKRLVGNSKGRELQKVARIKPATHTGATAAPRNKIEISRFHVVNLLFSILFRCRHKRITRPITPVSKGGLQKRETYVVCLGCGARLVYDLTEMRVRRPGSLYDIWDGRGK